MPSHSRTASPPKSARLDTLPADLRPMADKLIRHKFKHPEPEPEPEVVSKGDIKFVAVAPTFRILRYRLRAIGRSPRLQQLYGGYGQRSLMQELHKFPQVLEFSVLETEPSERVAEILRRKLSDLESQYGYVFQADLMP